MHKWFITSLLALALIVSGCAPAASSAAPQNKPGAASGSIELNGSGATFP